MVTSCREQSQKKLKIRERWLRLSETEEGIRSLTVEGSCDQTLVFETFNWHITSKQVFVRIQIANIKDDSSSYCYPPFSLSLSFSYFFFPFSVFLFRFEFERLCMRTKILLLLLKSKHLIIINTAAGQSSKLSYVKYSIIWFNKLN